MTVLLIVLLLVAGIAGYSVLSYNRFVRQQQLVAESWRQVDVELRRRADLVANLAALLAGHAAHERAAVESVLMARKRVLEPDGGPERAAEKDVEMSAALRRLIETAESYQRVTADSRFIKVCGELRETEDRIAAARRFYNAKVRIYNTRLATMPSALAAVGTSFQPARYFEVLDPAVRAPLPVRFDVPAPVVGQRPLDHGAAKDGPASG
ncbi:MAG TPA: LemA family protein [Frankiaceae bacterium]|nr:LemA family protein [Frankiaceae bacterium]